MKDRKESNIKKKQKYGRNYYIPFNINTESKDREWLIG
jgi:hypothetical protein